MNQTTDSVRITIFDQTDPSHFLVLSETDDPDNLKLPGGKFESENESPDEAAARELFEELGVTSKQVSLTRAGELTNDDGSSRRYIYFGQASLNDLKPSHEIDHIEWRTEETVPAGKNRDHILSAVALSRKSLSNNNPK